MPAGGGCGRMGGLAETWDAGLAAVGFVLTTGRGEAVAVGFGLAPPDCVAAGDEACCDVAVPVPVLEPPCEPAVRFIDMALSSSIAAANSLT